MPDDNPILRQYDIVIFTMPHNGQEMRGVVLDPIPDSRGKILVSASYGQMNGVRFRVPMENAKPDSYVNAR